MKRGDAVLIRRFARPGKPRATDVPVELRGTVVKAVSGVVWVDVGGETVRAWRSQVWRVDDDGRATELPSGVVARVDA